MMEVTPEELGKKRLDSPQVRRKSWPAAPRSILKKRPIIAAVQPSSTSDDTESGLGQSLATNQEAGEEDQIQVLSNSNGLQNSSESKQPAVIQDEANSANSAATVVSARTARKRRIAGIFQHYYPEGGWGYVVLICAFLTHFLAHGLQFGFLILMPFAQRRYNADQYDSGKQL